MLSHFCHQVLPRHHRAGRRTTGVSMRFEQLENRRLFAADGFSTDASVQSISDGTGELAAQVSTVGGPHVKVFNGASSADGDGDVDGRDFLIWQRTLGSTANHDAMFNDLGADTSSDSLPMEQLTLNYTKIYAQGMRNVTHGNRLASKGQTHLFSTDSWRDPRGSTSD